MNQFDDFASVYGPGDYRVWVEDLETGIRHWTSRDPSGRILREHEVGPGESWTHVRDYLHGVDGLVATRHRNGTKRFFHADHLGTPRLITTATGGILEELHYYPFGRQANPPPQSQVMADGFESGDFTGWNEDHDELSYKFTGHQRDRNRLTDYMLGRNYIFLANRFASVDPARDGWNLYSYARNNPVGAKDPDGRKAYLLTVGPGQGLFEAFGHSAVFVASASGDRAGVSLGGDHGFEDGLGGFIRGYLGEGRDVRSSR